MPLDQVLRVLDLLAAAGVASVWLDGGWGVDALLGHQSRPHQDLDLVIEERDLANVVTCLQQASFHELPDGRPWNLVMADHDNHQIDLHVIRLGEDGAGLYGSAGAAYPASSLTGAGRIGPRAVRCLTADYQLESHTGYEHDEDDVGDVLALHRRFGLALPAQYLNATASPDPSETVRP